jgi:hypothetical protein
MRDPAGHDDEIPRRITYDLVGDVEASGFCVVSSRLYHGRELVLVKEGWLPCTLRRHDPPR